MKLIALKLEAMRMEEGDMITEGDKWTDSEWLGIYRLNYVTQSWLWFLNSTPSFRTRTMAQPPESVQPLGNIVNYQKASSYAKELHSSVGT